MAQAQVQMMNVVKLTGVGTQVLLTTADLAHATRYARAESQRSGVSCVIRPACPDTVERVSSESMAMMAGGLWCGQAKITA